MNFDNLPRGSLFALMLIIAGAVLFLDNLGILPIRDIHAYWPIFLVIWGVSMFDRMKSPATSIWGVAMMAWGILLILGNLQIIHVTGSVFWPVMLIAFGVTMLMRPTHFRDWPERVRVYSRARMQSQRDGFLRQQTARVACLRFIEQKSGNPTVRRRPGGSRVWIH